MADDPSITMSVSATTRPMRPGEVDGRDYRFVSDAEFDQLIADDEFAEWAYVFDHRYGSPKEPIKEALKDGRDILFDIDWQGTQQIEYAFRTDLVRIFILLHPCAGWASDWPTAEPTAGSDRFRMRRAALEIGHWAEI